MHLVRYAEVDKMHKSDIIGVMNGDALTSESNNKNTYKFRSALLPPSPRILLPMMQMYSYDYAEVRTKTI